MTATQWVTDKRDDTQYILDAMREWNFRQPAWKKHLRFSDLPPAEQSRVLMRAAELKGRE